MKVAYNNCFGGFSLSTLATTEFAKKKGIDLTWYEQTGYKHEGNEEYKKIEGASEKNGMGVFSLTKDHGDVINEVPNDDYYYPDFYKDDSRADPDLIEVIERLGEKADGFCASLAIKEIPDNSEFEITEYDGNEDVVPPRMSW